MHQDWKAAVIGMTKVQGEELAGTRVTVNALAPAVFLTPKWYKRCRNDRLNTLPTRRTRELKDSRILEWERRR
jgi:NAD(P)-dependent dehydrogenase (short-subunit alcohol dehydrogenase family)